MQPLSNRPAADPVRPRELACRFCRDRHYRCDNEYPTCGRCRRARIPCERAGPLRFRYYGKHRIFSRDQTWLALPGSFEFVDETSEVIRDFLGYSSGEESTDATASHGSRAAGSVAIPTRLSADCRSTPLSGESSGLQETSLSGPLPSRATREWSDSFAVSGCPLSHVEGPAGRPRQEALLLRHFVDNVSPFFDFNDHQRTFATEVPQKARTNRTLFAAVLALAARHLSRVSDFSPYISDHYYQECLQHLIPALADDEKIDDDGLLAATVILRLLEEMDGTWVCEPNRSGKKGGDPAYGGCAHLLGSRALMHAPQKSRPTKLREAASWAGYRQELFTSLLNQRSPHLSSTLCSKFCSFDKTDDCTWAHRAVAHCLRTIDFAFGRTSSSKERYHDLIEENREWRSRVPSSFDACFADNGEDDDDEPARFPPIRLHADWHVMGFQYNTLAHFVLLTHDPGIPRIGLKHLATLRTVDELARKDIRSLCGVALSNPGTKAAFMVACMGIALGGDRFPDFEEQKRLMDILRQTEHVQGWPTVFVQTSLREAWGWRDEEAL